MEDGTPVTTQQLFAIIGELLVQVRVLQSMLRQKLEGEESNAIKGSKISSNSNEVRQES